MIHPSVSLWCPCRAPCSCEDRRPCSHLAPPPAAPPAPSRSCRHSPGQSLTEPGRASQSPGRMSPVEAGGLRSADVLVIQMRAGQVLLLLPLLSEGSLPLSLLSSVRSAAADFPSANGIYRPLDEGPIRELGCCTEALEEEEGER